MASPNANPTKMENKSKRSGSSIGMSTKSGHNGQLGHSGRGGSDLSSSLSTRKPMADKEPEAAPTVRVLSISLGPNFAVSSGKCMPRHVYIYLSVYLSAQNSKKSLEVQPSRFFKHFGSNLVSSVHLQEKTTFL